MVLNKLWKPWYMLQDCTREGLFERRCRSLSTTLRKSVTLETAVENVLCLEFTWNSASTELLANAHTSC